MTEYEKLGDELKWQHDERTSDTVSNNISVLSATVSNKGIKDES